MNSKEIKKENDLIAEAYTQVHTEDLDDDKAHSRAGLAPFSSTEEDDGWSATETVEFHCDEIVKIAAEFMGDELSHHKVNQYEDVHSDLRDDVSGWVINELQKQGKLPRRLDYEEAAQELLELKSAIDDKLHMKFDDMRDVYNDSKGKKEFNL